MMCLAWRGGIAAAGAALSLMCCGQALAQETCQTATAIAIGPAFVANNSAAASDGPANACFPIAHDVWHSFVPSLAGQHTISLCGSSFDTVAALYGACGAEPLDCSDNSCGLQSQIVANLIAGQTYFVRVGARADGPDGGVGGAYRVQITSPSAAPANNICGSGTVLPPNQSINGSNSGSSGTDANGECGGALDRTDVWYSFNPAASGAHIVELCSTAFDAVLSVHSSCFNSQLLGCSDNDAVAGCAAGSGARVVFNGAAGSPVLIRVAGVNGGFGPYSLVMHTAASNDSCDAPRPLVRGIAFTSNITPALATEGEASCAVSANDAWHLFVPSTTSPHLFSLCGSTFDTVLSIHRGCPGSPEFSELACSDDGCGPIAGPSQLMLNATLGEAYYVRVAGRANGGVAARGAYTLRVDLATPANDACTSPIALSEGVPVTGVTFGATGSDVSACGSGDAHDVWYSFVPDHNGVFEINTCGSATNTVLSLFNDCGTEAACSDDEPAYCGNDQSTGSRIVRLLAVDTVYLLRVASVGNIDGAFRLVVNRAPPTNDQCGNAAVLAEGVARAVTLSGAGPSGFDACGGGNAADVYYAFTPTSTRFYRVSTCGSASRTSLSLYASCPPAALIECSTTANAACGSPRSTDLTAVLRSGIPYRVRVAAAPGQTESAGFQVQLDAVGPPNDDCSRAQILLRDALVLASTVAASGDELSPCGAGDTHDVWFQFTPDITGSYEFRTCAAPDVAAPNTTLTVFDSCAGEVLACNDDAASGGLCSGGPALSAISMRLDAGQDYIIRAAIVGGGEGAFNVGVRAIQPANDTCATAQAVSTGLVIFDTIAATTDAATLSGCGLGFTEMENDVWFRFVPNTTSTVVVSSCGSGFDTALAVIDGQSGCSSPGNVVACDDDYDCDQTPATPDTASRAVFEGVTGRPYYIRIGSLVGARGPGELRISTGAAPVCPCDWNQVGGRTVQDIFDFLADWFAGAGDFNQTGTSDLQDLFDFLACFLGASPGCA